MSMKRHAILAVLTLVSGIFLANYLAAIVFGKPAFGFLVLPPGDLLRSLSPNLALIISTGDALLTVHFIVVFGAMLGLFTHFGTKGAGHNWDAFFTPICATFYFWIAVTLCALALYTASSVLGAFILVVVTLPLWVTTTYDAWMCVSYANAPVEQWPVCYIRCVGNKTGNYFVVGKDRAVLYMNAQGIFVLFANATKFRGPFAQKYARRFAISHKFEPQN